MQGERDRSRSFNRRMALLAAGKTVLLSTLVGRMYFLQVVEGDKYRTLSDENRISVELLPPARGEIVDRNGKPLAINRQMYRALLVREHADDVAGALSRLNRVAALSGEDVDRVLRSIDRRRGFVPVVVREDLSWEELARIEVNVPDLPGIHIDEGQRRFYPNAESTAHVLGYVAQVSESELADAPVLQVPGFRIGKAGVEKTYDLELRGTAGTSQVEVNAVGRVTRELSRNKGRAGRDISLTIDANLQDFAHRRMSEGSGAAVVLDVHSGDVLAMVSTPAFDPNAFIEGLNASAWQALVNHPRNPLNNRAIAGQYAPGSTFKMMVALAALRDRVVTPETIVHCRGYIDLGGTRFHCWKRGGHGEVHLNKAIAESCDVYFYEMARRVGIDGISEMAGRFGLGQTSDVDIPGEQPGFIPTRAWKEAVRGEAWHEGETVISGIGQGYILATPLQLAVMTAELANGGIAIKPRLVRATASGLPGSNSMSPTLQRLDVPSPHLRLIQDAMSSVVNSRRGTAFSARIDEPGLEMAGKTGTAQVRRISSGERRKGVRKNEDLPWKQRDHALFVGFAPLHAPRVAVSVVVEHGGGGSATAAPIARDILLTTQRLLSQDADNEIARKI